MKRRTILFAAAAFAAGCLAAMDGYAQGVGYPSQAYPGQTYPGQTYPGQTYPGQAYPGAAYPGAQATQSGVYPGGGYPIGSNPAAAPSISDQAGPAVARLSVMNGEASVKHDTSAEWMPAVVNAPLMAGDGIATASSGQVEVQLDYADFLRLAGDTEVRLANLSDGRGQLQVGRGLILYRALRDSAVQTEISTPSVAVHPLRLSAVRVEVAADGSTRITMRKGEADVYTPKGTERLREGSMMMVRGAADDPEFQIVQAPARDGWDSWNEQRDAFLEKAQSNRYVTQGTYGAEDLDAAGRWGYDPAYGNVWTPSNVPAGWAPYSTGQWVWEDYYGWTWVDTAPWGWAPFHYGAWYFRTGFGWSWFPGARYGRAFYRPALVSFVGFGGGVGVGFGRIGWVPLAPFEVFHPWYGPGARAGVVAGFGAGAGVVGIYRNARVAGGVMAVSTADFQRGAFHAVAPAGAGELQRASAVHGALPVSPGAASARFSARPAAVTPRTNFGSQRFFSSSAGFQSGGFQSGGFQSGGFQSGASRAFAQPGAVGGAGRSFSGGVPQAGTASSGGAGWNRFGNPAAGFAPRPATGGAATGRPVTGAPAPGGGWGSFGAPPQGAAVQRYQAAPQRQIPGGSYGSQPVQVAPPIVRQRETVPQYSAPQSGAPRSGSVPHSSGHASSAARGRR